MGEDLVQLSYNYDGVQLAFVGDAVFDLYVRTRLLKENKTLKADKLHRLKSSIVSANFQSKVINSLKDSLSEDEITVFKRARNLHGKSAPKSTTASKYRNATGFEALLGTLFLADYSERLEELMKIAYDMKFEEKNEKQESL